MEEDIKYTCYTCLQQVDRIYAIDLYTTYRDICANCLKQMIAAMDDTHAYFTVLALEAETVQAAD